LPVSKFASVRPLVLSAAAAFALSAPALAEDTAPPEAPAPDAPTLECAAEPVSGSGPGFSSSRDASEDAARAAWLEKAKGVYPEATWETAKDAGVSCAVQGLYSKCFAQGIPCRVKSASDDSDTPDSDATESGDAESESGAPEAAEVPKAE
jgi:hypothetical protein